MMVLKTTKTAVAVLLIFTLAACGGGGGGGGDTPAPTNAAPSISGSPTTSLNVGEDYSFTPTASDPDGDTLSFSIQNAPMWAIFDQATGTLSGNPAASNIGSVDDIAITVTDGRLADTLSAFSIAVMPEKVGRTNFTPMGTVTPLADGYQSDGDLVLSTDTQEQIFRNASLTLTFDENDVLEDLSGETDVPIRLSDNAAINGSVRSVVQTMTGRQINAD
ncbi:MAG: putative Ig domain-containing protein, partial [Coleofasciculaceae cyanobacterium]